MTANERLEALLNRCGQTISDLPQNHFGLIGRVANLVDIIDRMEWALENAAPIKPLAKWLAGYSFPPDEIAAERWEDFLRGMDWRADDADD